MAVAHPKPACVVLGGGGAKGFVHVGVLEALVRQDYHIVSIVGTSIGAFIGAMFAYERAVQFSTVPILDAQRQAMDRLRDFWLTVNLKRYTNRRLLTLLTRGHLSSSHDLEALILEQLLSPTHDSTSGIFFHELDFDLTLTATDVTTGAALVFNREICPTTDVSAAVRASISLPGAFPAAVVECNGKTYRCWDGGLAGNCPVDIARQKNPNSLIIVSSLTYRGDPSFETRRFRKLHYLFEQSINTVLKNLDDRIFDGVLSRDHICVIRPNLSGVTTYDFDISRATRQLLFNNGRTATEQELKL